MVYNFCQLSILSIGDMGGALEKKKDFFDLEILINQSND